MPTELMNVQPLMIASYEQVVELHFDKRSPSFVEPQIEGFIRCFGFEI
jgi:hypothetical protein